MSEVNYGLDNIDHEGERSPEDAMKIFQEAASATYEITESETIREFETYSESMTVKQILNRWTKKKLVVPFFQRKYVWNQAQRESLLNSIKAGFPCGSIIIGELNGVLYLIDGLQRLSSFAELLNDSQKTQEEKECIRSYRIRAEIVRDMSMEEMQHFFAVLNSGTVVSAAVKERTSLSQRLNGAVMHIAAHPIFDEVPINSTFNRNAHHELIAENTLLAACGQTVGNNKAKELCKRLTECEEIALASVEKAQILLDRLLEAYRLLRKSYGPDEKSIKTGDGICKRSFNANFSGVLVYYLADHPSATAEEIKEVIEYIFGNLKSKKEYSETVKGGAGDKVKCEQRLAYIGTLFEDLYGDDEEMIEQKFEEFCSLNNGNVIKDSTEEYILKFSEFTLSEKKDLFDYQYDQERRDRTIYDAVRRLERCGGYR